MNVLGRLLKQVRDAVKSEPRENLLREEPLPIKTSCSEGIPSSQSLSGHSNAQKPWTDREHNRDDVKSQNRLVSSCR